MSIQFYNLILIFCFLLNMLYLITLFLYIIYIFPLFMPDNAFFSLITIDTANYPLFRRLRPGFVKQAQKEGTAPDLLCIKERFLHCWTGSIIVVPLFLKFKDDFPNSVSLFTFPYMTYIPFSSVYKPPR